MEDICEILDLDEDRQQAEALAARGNMTAIVRALHDPGSQLMDMLVHSLSQGKLCVVDLSQMRGAQAMILAGLILRRIFDRNQEEFTRPNSQTIPTIAVIEEAQSVLVEGAVSAEPYIAWVKEGRKYDLGAVLVTQQPGSIPVEILSQGDNWFIFHLLAAADLNSLSKANAHFSTDLLSALLNEPIKGQGVFWSSEGGKPYPVAVRVLLFEQRYKVRDLQHSNAAAKTFAATLRAQFSRAAHMGLATAPSAGRQPPSDAPTEITPLTASELTPTIAAPGVDGDEEQDILASIEERAVAALRSDGATRAKLEGDGMAWGALNGFIKERALPPTTDDANQVAYSMVPRVLDAVYGPQNQSWHSFKRDGKTWVRKGPRPA